MVVDLKKVYAKVAESKQAEKRKVFVKVSNNGAVLGINGNREKVEDVIKNLYANQRDIIDFSKLGSTDLSKYHLIVIGSHDKKAALADRLKTYTEEGGYLVTTAKCLEFSIGNDVILYLNIKLHDIPAHRVSHMPDAIWIFDLPDIPWVLEVLHNLLTI